MQFAYQKKLSQRSGTVDLGKLYELKIVALLALRCIENPRVKHAWFASNVNHAYDFDDVILYVKDRNDLCTAYLMQLKHQEKPQNIARKEFKYGAKTESKNNTLGDFSLFKYQSSYLQIKKNLDGCKDDKDGLIASLKNAHEIFYVLYTNRPLGAKYDFLKVSGDERSLLDTSDGECNVYGFNAETSVFNGEFLLHLQLFTKQEHVTKIDQLIKKELKRVMEAANVKSVNLNDLLKKFVDFVEIGIKCTGRSTFDALTKEDLVAQLTSFILDDYLVKFPLNSSSRSQFLLWSEIIEGKTLVVVEMNESTSEFLTSHVAAKIAEHCSLDNWNQELSKVSFYEKYPDLKQILVKTIGNGGLTPSSVYQALWLQKKVPLLVQAPTQKDFKRVQAALHLSRDSNYPIVVLTSIAVPTTLNGLFDLNHLDQKCQQMVLDHPITLQERSGSRLSDVLDKSMYKMIKCRDIINIISNRYNIGNAQGTILKFYVPRTISNIVLETTSSLRNDNYRFVNVTRDIRMLQFQTCSWLHPDELVKVLNHSPYVISANPGMGKTEFFNYLSLNAPTNLWTLKVNLNEHNDYYKTLMDAEKTALDHLRYFYGNPHSLNQELTEKVFLKFVKQKNILVLLDGFDEILMTYKKEATSIATSLHESGYKIWVSTRPVTEAHLEDALNTISCTLKPLEIKDQKNFLIQYFEHMAGNADQKQTVVEFVEKLLEAAAANLNDSDNRFTGLPLQTKLLADVFMKDLEEILKTGKFLFNNKFDLISLYDSILKEKTNIFCRKFGEIYRDMHTFFEKWQQLFALQIVFPARLLEKLGIVLKLKEHYEDDDRIIHFLQREGVVVIHRRDKNLKEKFDVNFVHRTFAEFLAAKWLYNSFKVENVRDLIECRFVKENEFVFNIFDRYLAKDIPLHLSIINRNKFKALELIRLDPDSINRVDSGGRTILHLIACYGLDHWSYIATAVVDEMVEVIDALSENVMTDVKDDLLGYNALEYAISSNTFAVADKLCQKSEQLQFALNLYDKFFIFLHCFRNQYRYLFWLILKHFARKELLNKKIKPSTSIDSYCSNSVLLEYASEYKSKTVLDLVRDTRSEDDVGFVAAFGSKEELLRLLDEGVNVNKADSSGYTALHYATIHNRLEVVKLLVSKGASVNKQNHSNTVPSLGAHIHSEKDGGESALHLAVKNKNFDVAHMLIDEGADVNLADACGTTAFLNACEHGKSDLVKRILRTGTDLNLQSALHRSFKNSNFDVVRTLIEEGAEVNSVDNSGRTVLLHACKFGKVDLVKKILPMVTSINLQNELGESALHLSVKQRNAPQVRLEIVELLIKHGIDINLQDMLGCTVLHLTCWSKFITDTISEEDKTFFKAVALILLQEPGIELNLKTIMGDTPLDLVRGNTEIDLEVLEILENK